MEEVVLDLDYAKFLVRYPDMTHLFSAVWDQFTEVDYEALDYLVRHSEKILLRNIRSLSPEKMTLLRKYKGELVLGFSIEAGPDW